jgi:hypothetical protein
MKRSTRTQIDERRREVANYALNAKVMGLTPEQTAAIVAANMGNESPLPPVDACTDTLSHVAATS